MALVDQAATRAGALKVLFSSFGWKCAPNQEFDDFIRVGDEVVCERCIPYIDDGWGSASH